MWCERPGHEMIFVGTPRQSPHANPAWEYTYLQASGSSVRLTQFFWNQRDANRGMRFGRFARLRRPGGEPPPPVEEDEMFEVVVPFARVDDQGNQHVWVATEGWYDLAQAAGSCYLLVKNEGAACSFDVFTTPGLNRPGGTEHFNLPDKDAGAGSRGAINMQALGAPKGGFATTIKCTSENIVPQITILANAK